MASHRTHFPESYHYVPDASWPKVGFTVLRAGEAVTAPGYRIARQDHPGQDVLFCRSGRGFALSEGVTMRVDANQLVWIANEMPHAHWPDDANPWHLLWLRMVGPDCAAIRRKVFGQGQSLVTLARPSQIELWFARLFQVLRRRESDIDLAVNHLMGEFLYLLATRTEQPGERALPKALRLVMAAMRDAPGQAWSAEAIAIAGGTSAAHVRRLFRQHLGLSPRHWLMNERIILSQRLLSEHGMTVAEAAERCGFCDVYHFTRIFRRAVGLGPAAWRQAEGPGQL